ncbi:unnamed protein product [Gadus morhua 'NCC']
MAMAMGTKRDTFLPGRCGTLPPLRPGREDHSGNDGPAAVSEHDGGHGRPGARRALSRTHGHARLQSRRALCVRGARGGYQGDVGWKEKTALRSIHCSGEGHGEIDKKNGPGDCRTCERPEDRATPRTPRNQRASPTLRESDAMIRPCLIGRVKVRETDPEDA